MVKLLRFCYHLTESYMQLVSIKQHQLNRSVDGMSSQAPHELVEYATQIHEGAGGAGSIIEIVERVRNRRNDRSEKKRKTEMDRM